MRTIDQSLAWKEWHEHKWKLMSITAILLGIAAMFVLDFNERWMLAGVRVTLIVCIVPLAVFIGLGEAAGERSRGTLPFLQSLPVPMWRVALHKLVFGLVTILAPLLLTLGIVLALYQLLASSEVVAAKVPDTDPFTWGISNWFVDSTLMLVAVAASFYIWTVATGVNRKDEVSAGAVALAAMLGWGLLLAAAWYLASRVFGFVDWTQSPESWTAAELTLGVAGLSTAPGGLVTISALARDSAWQTVGGATFITWILPVGLSIAAITHVALATWYVRRFGRISDLEVRSPKTAEVGPGQLDWLGAPRRSPLTAIAWKQFRESGPLALVGVAIILGIVAVIAAVDRHNFANDFGQLFMLLAAVSVSLGLAVAMIVGIGVFLYDVGPRLNEFWRSRPVNPDLWFWTKFLSGLAILLAAIYGPIVIAVLPGIIQLAVHLAATPESASLTISRLAASPEPALLIFPTLTIAIFAAAAAMTCLVRNAVYTAILSIAVVYLGIVAVALALGIARLMRGDGWPEGFELFDVTATQAVAGLLLSFITSTLVAWLAVRNDWGQKSRY